MLIFFKLYVGVGIGMAAQGSGGLTVPGGF